MRPLKTKTALGSASPTPWLSDQELLAQCGEWTEGSGKGSTPEPRGRAV